MHQSVNVHQKATTLTRAHHTSSLFGLRADSSLALTKALNAKHLILHRQKKGKGSKGTRVGMVENNRDLRCCVSESTLKLELEDSAPTNDLPHYLATLHFLPAQKRKRASFLFLGGGNGSRF